LNKEQRMLVAVDVDGTLLDTEFDDVLGKREIAALQSVRDAGHVLALCTGRNTRSVRGLLDQSGWNPDDLPLILLNGALVWGGLPRRQLVRNLLDGDSIRRLIPLFREHGTVPLVYGADEDGGVVHHESRPVNDVLGRYLGMRSRTVGAITRVDDLLEISWQQALEVGTIDEKDKIEALTRDIHARLDGKVAVINTRSLLGQGRYYWAEVYRAGSDKGRGLQALAAEVGIAADRTVAIGDNYNDLAMFAVAGCSVAMGNSPDEVKIKADRVAGDVGHGGAAEILESIAAGEFACGGHDRD
jgi:Cof subfamily protein (haloacid dehalogenase superfamily)